MALSIPRSLKIEHEHLHADLVKGTREDGEVGVAARAVASALHAHFEKEEEYAMPPLGALGPLAEGRDLPEKEEVASLSAKMRAELPQMLAEHRQIVSALDELREAAMAEGKPEYAEFADRLVLHAQNEEEVLYPVTILLGDLLEKRRLA